MTLTSELERAHPPAAPGEAPLTSRRLSILTRREIDDLYGLPRFTEEDQQLYFDLSAAEEARVRAMHTDSAKVHFVLQFGYFKAKRQFFVYACNEVQEDLRHISPAGLWQRSGRCRNPPVSSSSRSSSTFSIPSGVARPQSRIWSAKRGGSRCVRRSRSTFCEKCCNTWLPAASWRPATPSPRSLGGMSI